MKVFVLSTVAFTLILSLGSVLRPVQEYGASAVQVFILLGCFLPITLTFVLPISAIFASALVYGRFASDNELDACRASGISLLTVVYPGIFLALAVSIAALVLSFHIMPHFVHQAETVIKSDLKQMCFRNIQKKGYYALPGKSFRIYADYADIKSGELAGVAIVESKGSIFKRTIEAERARIDFFASPQINKVEVAALDVYQTDSDGQELFFNKLPLTYQFPSLLSDNIRFKKLNEIKKIRNNPIEFTPVRMAADSAYKRLLMELIAADIRLALGDSKQGGFYRGFSNDNRKLIFTCDGISVKDESKIELFGNIRLLEYDIASGQEIANWMTNRALLQIEDEDGFSTFSITLFDAARKKDNNEMELRFRPYFRNLKMPKTVAAVLPADKMQAINSIVSDSPAFITLKKMPAELSNQAKYVQREIIKTKAGIAAELNTRLVFGLGCVGLVLSSVGLGIIFKGGHLLSAFGISTIPAAFLIVCIMAGKNITKNMSAHSAISGTALMWAGLIVLSIFVVFLYRKLLRL